MIKYFFDTETKDYIAVKENSKLKYVLKEQYEIAAFSLNSTPKTVKIQSLSLRYAAMFLKRISVKKVPIEWKNALSIINYVA